MSELTNQSTESEVINLMKSSRAEAEWNLNCDKVKTAFNGYPDWWYRVIVLSGLAQQVRDQFLIEDTTKRVREGENDRRFPV